MTPGVELDSGRGSSRTSRVTKSASGGKTQEFGCARDVVRRVGVAGVTQIGGQQRQGRLDIDALSIPDRESRDGEPVAEIMRPKRTMRTIVEARLRTRLAKGAPNSHGCPPPVAKAQKERPRGGSWVHPIACMDVRAQNFERGRMNRDEAIL